ncbi:MAG: hydrolase 1, exosortase A system-associated [Steroidobacteraceae bacterium]
MTTVTEEALLIDCEGARMLGVLHRPGDPRGMLGVVVVVGGPQYRVGSHRQFVLMARAFAAHGYPVLRFDYRGMGDSDGDYRGFEQVDADLRAAIDALLARVPVLDGVVLWGLCDGASAALLYAPRDARVRGIALVNGWVRTTGGEASAFVKHYYGARLLQRDFWRKLLTGQVNLVHSLRDFVAKLRRARGAHGSAPAEEGFIAKMLRNFERFAQPMLLLESGQDLTAAEFSDLRSADPRWSQAAGRANVTQLRLADADHTFSRGIDLAAAQRACLDWLDGLKARRQEH